MVQRFEDVRAENKKERVWFGKTKQADKAFAPGEARTKRGGQILEEQSKLCFNADGSGMGPARKSAGKVGNVSSSRTETDFVREEVKVTTVEVATGTVVPASLGRGRPTVKEEISFYGEFTESSVFDQVVMDLPVEKSQPSLELAVDRETLKKVRLVFSGSSTAPAILVVVLIVTASVVWL